MKKLFVLFVLFSAMLFGQSQIIYKSVGTLTEAVTKTVYVPLGDWSRIDSVSLSLAGTGEIDVDSVNVYPGFKMPQGKAYYSGTALTFLADPNIAASTDFWTNGVASTADKDAATVLTSAVMRHGINILKVTVAGADGCDATDPNELILIFNVWGIPKGGS